MPYCHARAKGLLMTTLFSCDFTPSHKSHLKFPRATASDPVALRLVLVRLAVRLGYHSIRRCSSKVISKVASRSHLLSPHMGSRLQGFGEGCTCRLPMQAVPMQWPCPSTRGPIKPLGLKWSLAFLVSCVATCKPRWCSHYQPAWRAREAPTVELW